MHQRLLPTAAGLVMLNAPNASEKLLRVPTWWQHSLCGAGMKCKQCCRTVQRSEVSPQWSIVVLPVFCSSSSEPWHTERCLDRMRFQLYVWNQRSGLLLRQCCASGKSHSAQERENCMLLFVKQILSRYCSTHN